MDIFDIGRIYFSYDDISTAKRRNKKIDNLFSGSYILGVLDFFLKFCYFLLTGRINFPKREREHTKVLFYGVSRNNRLTLEPIIKELGEENVMSFVYQKSFPSWKLYWHALPHFYELIKEIRRSDKEKRKILKMFFPKFWRMYGCPHVITEMLNIYEPKIVVMANDHQEFNRCLMLMCKERKIETIYVQHASVGTKFPPLQFSYSLLDGMDAFSKYKKIGDMQGSIYLMGGVRFDMIKPLYMEHPHSFVIGVAINVVDDPAVVKKTCKDLLGLIIDNNPVKVVMRPHPQMQERQWHKWCDENNIGYSSPSHETSFEFIGRISLLLANQSSIHLDTAMCHKYSVIYNMSSRLAEDLYLFKKNKLAREVTNIQELQQIVNHINAQKINEEAVKYYSCSYGCDYEGRVASLISNLITSILCDDVSSFNKRYNFTYVENSNLYNVLKYNSNDTICRS